jgi:hypothetical protein
LGGNHEGIAMAAFRTVLSYSGINKGVYVRPRPESVHFCQGLRQIGQ